MGEKERFKIPFGGCVRSLPFNLSCRQSILDSKGLFIPKNKLFTLLFKEDSLWLDTFLHF